MTVFSKSNITPSVSAVAEGASGFGGLVTKLSKIVLNRSVAILWWTGLIALMAGFRMATNSGVEGDEMFRAWMLDWVVIWVILAAVSLRLLKPIFDYVVTEQNAHTEASMMRELSKMEPSFANEMRAMALHQQLRDEQARENSAAASEALAALGGLTVNPNLKVGQSLPLGSRLGSVT